MTISPCLGSRRSRPNTDSSMIASARLTAEPTGDQLEIARLKRRKLQLKDRIEQIVDSNIPDIIA